MTAHAHVLFKSKTAHAHAYWKEITADAHAQLMSNNYSWSCAT